MSGGTILQSSILGRLVRWIACAMQRASYFRSASTSALNLSPAPLQLFHRNRNAFFHGKSSSPLHPPSHPHLTTSHRFESPCRLSGHPPFLPLPSPPTPLTLPPHHLKSPPHCTRRSQKMRSKVEDLAVTTLSTVIASSSCGHCKQLRQAPRFRSPSSATRYHPHPHSFSNPALPICCPKASLQMMTMAPLACL